MAEVFNFTSWAHEAKIKRDLTGALEKEDFNTVEVLLLISPEDVRNLPGTAGQKILLCKALAELGNESFASLKRASGDNHEDGEGNGDDTDQGGVDDGDNSNRQPGLLQRLDRDIDNLQGGGVLNNPPQSNVDLAGTNTSLDLAFLKGNGDFDELSILCSGAKAGEKALMPYDVLDTATQARIDRRRKERNVIERDGDGRLVVKSDFANVPPLSMAEWGIGAHRVGIQLLLNKQLDWEGYVRYNAYVATVWHLAERHVWSSVLEYDYTYRQTQAARGLRWGARSQFEESHNLVKLEDKNQRFKNGTKQGNSNYHGKQSNEPKYCRQFLANGFCRFGQTCKFEHVLPANTAQGRDQRSDHVLDGPGTGRQASSAPGQSGFPPGFHQ